MYWDWDTTVLWGGSPLTPRKRMEKNYEFSKYCEGNK